MLRPGDSHPQANLPPSRPLARVHAEASLLRLHSKHVRRLGERLTLWPTVGRGAVGLRPSRTVPSKPLFRAVITFHDAQFPIRVGIMLAMNRLILAAVSLGIACAPLSGAEPSKPIKILFLGDNG